MFKVRDGQELQSHYNLSFCKPEVHPWAQSETWAIISDGPPVGQRPQALRPVGFSFLFTGAQTPGCCEEETSRSPALSLMYYRAPRYVAPWL